MNWYEDEVKELEKVHLTIEYEPETLFYGSSSIRLWTSLYDDFKYIKPVNLGFGGSTLAACVWFFDRIMLSYQPKRLVLYAGDNDLGDGRNPEEVLIFFQQLVAKTALHFGNIPCYFVSLKPSPSRWHIVNQFKSANTLIKNEIVNSAHTWKFVDVFNEMLDVSGHPQKKYYSSDGLHLSDKGYELWKEVISNHITHNY
ncbi:GDSL-type esterase/lipase family protein [Arcticibacter eurypsychrophilus]|uniref:GDSL-type esterase/lipase family protein n=1 Tax=Arcticibacter eurypsychrophilus TaxID=1434752 RepID=UPI00084D7758|nr:GDSL-type esterase/lipase family protein [Arcticibacter eurypsychrophilus]